MFREKISDALNLLHDYEPIVVYLFGSAKRNELRADSDIDIAFLSEQNIKPFDCFMKAQQLADIFKRDVDLVDLSHASEVFTAQVLRDGEVVYCGNNLKRMEFEMVSLKKYAKLNEEREVVLEKIRESGRVYGE
ncbi:MAG: type VII toxin-antitoxin system MntA family adenylyltransferase antitoxin [Bacilli bacterium]